MTTGSTYPPSSAALPATPCALTEIPGPGFRKPRFLFLSNLAATLLYGGGLRLMEGLRLRVKDLDFTARRITKPASCSTFRHSFASHLLQGVAFLPCHPPGTEAAAAEVSP